MKRILFSFLLCILLPVAALSQDFKEMYLKLDSLPGIDSLVRYGAVSPVWTDSVTFVYGTRGKSGIECYSVDISKASRSEISKDSLEAVKARFRKFWDNQEEDFRKEPVRETSPDGKQVAFIKDGNVWLADAAEGSEAVQLSFDGTANDCYTELHWSPDSRKIASIRAQQIKERQIPLISSAPEDQVQPKLRWLDYCKPGDLLPISVPALFDVESRSQIAIDTAPYGDQYFLTFGQWLPDSGSFTFEYNRRGHQLYQLIAVNSSDGSVKVLAEERSKTFVYYYDLYRYYFKDGKHILWISERDDWRHLYLVDTQTGSAKQLTKGAWNVREIFDVNENLGYVLFYANGMNAGEDPYNKHLLKLSLKTGKLTDLTPEPADHVVSFNKDFTAFVDVYSTPDTPPVSVVRTVGKAPKVAMELQKADISGLETVGWTAPEVFVAKGRDGITDIWGNIYRPMNFDPDKKYPVVEYIYAGPHDSFVDKDFRPYSRFSKLMELGFIVVSIDGMGTDNRSKSFQDVCWRNLKDSGFPDRILWIKAAAAKYPSMDISGGVGIYGYSAGGQSTLAALLFHGDFYKTGVALCGCHDNRMDKIWWNEQWMGYPIGPWYSENSNVDNAWRLPDDDHLMLVNGQMDDNVDPSSTLQVVNALVKANKEFEQYYMPMRTHNLGEDWVTRQVFRFFYENMK